MSRVPVAILDRSPSFLHLLVYVLQQRDGAEVEVIGAGNNVDELFKEAAAVVPAVVLVGLSVPNIVEPSLIQQLRTQWPDVGIIALSWLDQEEYQVQALSVGVNIVISKTQLDTALLPAIRHLVPLRHERHEGYAEKHAT